MSNQKNWAQYDGIILDWLREHGKDWHGLASRTGLQPGTIEARWRRHLRHLPESHAALATYGVAPVAQSLADIIELPVKPFPTVIGKPAKPHKGRWITAVLFGDTHMGFEDQTVLNVVLGVVKDVRPHVVVHVGDLLDCYSLSRFDKNPSRLMSLQDEIDRGRVLLEQVAQVAPQAERHLLEGNHEDRLRRTLWSQPGASAVFNLRKIQEACTWENILDLERIGWNWIPAQGQARVNILPKAITKHGTIVRQKSAYTARAEMDKYGKSGFSGHTHRLGTHWHSDANGAHFWVETGCTCLLKPEYVEDPDWQNGCYVVTFDRDSGAPAIEQVYIANGNAMWRGQRYEAAA